MAYVELQGLTKKFDDVIAVNGVDLHIDAGEFLVLLGPSGCGKTTLMRMIAGLEEPTSGLMHIAGDEMDADIPPRAREIAMVFQSYALYPHKTAFKNIAFPLESARTPRGEIEARVKAVAEMFHIGHLLNRFPRQLSGGERQRVALARAVVRHPKVFLFDEPLSNLDARQRAIARFELKQLQERLGATIVYVTHDQVEALGLGDRIAVMNKGTILQCGTPLEVYENPANVFVATFLGSPPMNLIRENGSVLLGFRPERFLPIGAFSGGEPLHQFTFRVKHVEFLGSDRLAYGSIPDAGEGTVIASLPITMPTSIDGNQTYEFAVDRRALRRFDRESGARIDGAA